MASVQLQLQKGWKKPKTNSWLICNICFGEIKYGDQEEQD